MTAIWAAYCRYGTGWAATGADTAQAARDYWQWRRQHDGPGHGPATAAQARQAVARAAQERAS